MTKGLTELITGLTNVDTNEKHCVLLPKILCILFVIIIGAKMIDEVELELYEMSEERMNEIANGQDEES